MVQEGKKAPRWKATDQDGSAASQRDGEGKYVVLYFYPKDDTPGCTVEACSFRDADARFKRAGALVFGASPDGGPRHQKFIEKFDLPFTLLSDPEHELAEQFGAWGEKMNYGKKYFGVLRKTFLIGPDGKVLKIWPKVKPEGHAEEVLAAIAAHRKVNRATIKGLRG